MAENGMNKCENSMTKDKDALKTYSTGLYKACLEYYKNPAHLAEVKAWKGNKDKSNVKR